LQFVLADPQSGWNTPANCSLSSSRRHNEIDLPNEGDSHSACEGVPKLMQLGAEVMKIRKLNDFEQIESDYRVLSLKIYWLVSDW
jgi:hypothetical protein